MTSKWRHLSTFSAEKGFARSDVTLTVFRFNIVNKTGVNLTDYKIFIRVFQNLEVESPLIKNKHGLLEIINPRLQLMNYIFKNCTTLYGQYVHILHARFEIDKSSLSQWYHSKIRLHFDLELDFGTIFRYSLFHFTSFRPQRNTQTESETHFRLDCARFPWDFDLEGTGVTREREREKQYPNALSAAPVPYCKYHFRRSFSGW